MSEDQAGYGSNLGKLMSDSIHQPTCVDLFAGCGGLSLGLEQAGFRTLLASEINESASETYKANRQKAIAEGLDVVSDVTALTRKGCRALKEQKKVWLDQGIDQVDLVCGGPPCQGYSGIGHRRTFKLDRDELPSNYLYKEMVKVIKCLKPKVFLFENVRGLLTGRWDANGYKGEIFEDVFNAFRNIRGYRVKWNLVHSKDYGVPQNRPRLLIVGIHKSLLPASIQSDFCTAGTALESGFLPKPKACKYPNIEDILGDLVDDQYGVDPQCSVTTKYPKAARGIQKEFRNGSSAKGCLVTHHGYTKHSQRITDKFNFMIKNRGKEIPAHFKTKKFAQKVLPAKWNQAGPSITVTSLPDDYVHYCQPRILTVREWARLQTFPDSYIFKGPRTTGGRRRAGDPDLDDWEREVPHYTQIGNAVPVWLAREIGTHIISLFREY